LLSGELDEVKNELGDLLLHIVFYAKIGNEQKAFDIADVANGISEKLIDRHPHIYGDVEVADETDVKKNWEKLKLKEGSKGVLSGVPQSLPSLVMASRMQDKAAGIGFDWKTIDGVKDKIREELSELDHEIKHGTKEKITDELGDVFFSLVNYARFLKINPDDALSSTNRRFRSRFEAMEKMAAQQGKALESLTTDQWEQLWQAAKKEQD
jgi:XTP/dITP diphosphohydrolase